MRTVAQTVAHADRSLDRVDGVQVVVLCVWVSEHDIVTLTPNGPDVRYVAGMVG